VSAQGHTTVDFGAWPGTAEARVTITGQAGILAASDVEAWIRGEDSADHAADEHIIEDFFVQAQNISAANGFLITAHPMLGRCYGVYNVSWCWS
jgi:hypothetical protein